MFQCHNCGANKTHEEQVSEVFQIYGKPVLVENIPAIVCSRCGETTFSRETTEKIRQMLHGDHQPTKAISVDVYAFK
ncbi:MAG: YgiT-type zinc finger protein [Tildeniella nuda ZEHNDER 1965/U140]|jgi:YgiT-type zinc finger domain-containing protein|nr:YgiT-type zinc finger protein [Tildeniella nuda ZEHNDER 1965/U140]